MFLMLMKSKANVLTTMIHEWFLLLLIELEVECLVYNKLIFTNYYVFDNLFTWCPIYLNIFLYKGELTFL
jgi:hypothetical protein